MPNPYTIVDAINQVVETVSEFPTTTQPSAVGDTTSIYARAEQFIDRARYQVLSLGWPENTEMSRPFTTASSYISMTGILSIQAAGPDQYRNLVIRKHNSGPAVYDANLRVFVTTGTVYLDAVILLNWDDLPLKLADVVVSKAKLLFQRRIQNGQLPDQQLQQEYIQAEMAVDRNEAKESMLPPNTRQNMPPQVQGGQQQQQGG